MPDDQGLPHIPFSRLKELRQTAIMYSLDSGFDDKTLWRIMVAVEVNQELAGKWYAKARELEEENKKLAKINREQDWLIISFMTAVDNSHLENSIKKLREYVEEQVRKIHFGDSRKRE